MTNKFLLANASKQLSKMTEQDLARVKGANGVAVLIWVDRIAADAALAASGLKGQMRVLEISESDEQDLKSRIGTSQVTFTEAKPI